MMTDFKIAKRNGEYVFVEFPEPLMDDGRPVVTIYATFRIDGGQKYYVHCPVTRQTLRNHVLLDAYLRREAEWLAAHPERIVRDQSH